MYGEVNLRDLRDILREVGEEDGGEAIIIDTQESVQEDTGRTLLAQMADGEIPPQTVTPAYQGRGTVPIQDTETETWIAVQVTREGKDPKRVRYAVGDQDEMENTIFRLAA